MSSWSLGHPPFFQHVNHHGCHDHGHQAQSAGLRRARSTRFAGRVAVVAMMAKRPMSGRINPHGAQKRNLTGKKESGREKANLSQTNWAGTCTADANLERWRKGLYKRIRTHRDL